MSTTSPPTGDGSARPRASGGAAEQPSADRFLIGIVDGDRAHAEKLSRLLADQGQDAECYESGELFLEAVRPDSVGCVIAELVMPGMSGHALQEELRTAAPALSVVVITDHADVPTTVELMNRGAVTVLEKPVRTADLVSAVARATEQSVKACARIDRAREIERRLATLTEEEHQIANEMIAGTPIKALARKFRISMRTIDRRRQSLLVKMEVSSVGELASLFAETLMRANAGRVVRQDQPVTAPLPPGHHRPTGQSQDESVPSSDIREHR